MRQFLRDGLAMTASVARRLIADERLARGIKLPEALSLIAREAGLSPGTLQNLLRGRLKRVEYVAGKLQALRIRKIEQRIAVLQHELVLARLSSVVPEVDLARAEAALQEALRALGKA